MMTTILEFLTCRRPGRPGIRGWIHCSLGMALVAGLPACSTGLNGPRNGQENFSGRQFREGPPGNASVVAGTSQLQAFSNPATSVPPMSPRVQPVGYQRIAAAARPAAPYHIQTLGAEERIPVSPFDTSADDARSRLAVEYPDEYLFDGGDRNYPMHYEPSGRAGLETEDTVAEFRDEAGKLRIKPTNRVAIYAPRFANVTTITHASEDMTVGRLASNASSLRDSALRERVVPGLENQPTVLQAVVERVRGSEVQDRQYAKDTRQEFRLEANVHTIYPATYGNFARTGELLNSDEAHLAEALQTAISLTRKQNPVIVAKLDSAADIKSYFRDTEVVGLKENVLSAGRLRIVKLADKHVAESGDVVTFTIRFDNQGHRPLSDLVVTDNLTPRLQYVPDSATSDRAGKLVTEENGEGSLVLRWEFDEPLPGRTGGVVTFQARVK